MPKAKYADRGKRKPKSIKARTKLSSKRKLSRFGKKQKKGFAGDAVNYITRTRAVRKLAISLRDFRKLCVWKGVYPREPKHRKAGNTQTYYHIKDISYLAHEPLLAKFRDMKAFLKRIARALGRHDMSEAKRMYQSKPTFPLEHLLAERYPRFLDALADCDDALSLVHLFASLPALHTHHIQRDRPATAQRLVREWQYYVARTHALRKVFLSIKGVYYQAEVKGVTVTWLEPWKFSQSIPKDVDYRVMQTFLEWYETLLKFVMFKLYHTAGLAYPPALKAVDDAHGSHLTALAAFPVTATAGAATTATPAITDMEASVRITTLRDKLKKLAAASTTEPVAFKPTIVAAPAASGKAVKGADGGGKGAVSAVVPPAPVDSSAGLEFVGGEDEGGGESLLADLASFEDSAEAQAAREAAIKLALFQSLFKGFVFFLNREVPREIFEFIICAFRGRVGWDGPSSPFTPGDRRITHHIIDRPLAEGDRVPGREYVQPQWVADSVNARMLLPVAKYAPGAVLPPHLSPFVDDAREGYVPAYRQELDRLRAAAAVTGRLADVLPDEARQAEVARITQAAVDAAEGVAPVAPDRGVKRRRVEDEDDDGDEDDDDDAEDEEDDEEEEEEEEDVEALVDVAMTKATTGGRRMDEDGEKGGDGAGAPFDLLKAERQALAVSMLSNRQRKTYEIVKASKDRREKRVNKLAERAKAAAARGDTGVGAVKGPTSAPGAPPAKAPTASVPATRVGDKRKRA